MPDTGIGARVARWRRRRGISQVALAGLTLAEHFCAQGRETLLFLNQQLLTEQTLQRIRERRRPSSAPRMKPIPRSWLSWFKA